MKRKEPPQLLTGSSLGNMVGILRRNSVEKKYAVKVLTCLLCSVVLTPWYYLEQLLFIGVRSHAVHPEPVFIIGHWRSGTTYLHYLLSRDIQFGYCSNAEAFAPGHMLIFPWLTRKVVAWWLPKTRPADGVMLNIDFPQEDEFPMMLLSPYSCYHAFAFPKTSKKIFNTYGIFMEDQVSAMHGWRKQYFHFLQKLSYRKKGKRLLLKNPANTTRIEQLKAMFPNAKFIYLYRNSDHVKQSTLRMFTALTKINCLQHFDKATLERQIENFHQEFIKSYERQRHFIKPENLIEIAYDDLVSNPLETVERIYRTLHLKGFNASRHTFETFIAGQVHHTPHHYPHPS